MREVARWLLRTKTAARLKLVDVLVGKPSWRDLNGVYNRRVDILLGGGETRVKHRFVLKTRSISDGLCVGMYPVVVIG